MDAKRAVFLALGFGLCFPLGWYTPWPVVVGLAGVGWLVQLAGHSVWEKNSPAFSKNLVHALVGPLFFAALLTGDWKLSQEADTSAQPARSL